jgi:CRISPR-associated protein Csb2
VLTLTIDLLAGRYHATPWGRAANEGEAEWPPSPWRIGRAIVSAWWRMAPDDRPDRAAVERILAKLVSPPRFVLPPATAGHTRHYMPKPNARSRSDTALVLDPFVRTDGTSLDVIWEEVDLDQADRDALGELLDGIGYLGRAESPAVLRLGGAAREKGVVVAPFDDGGDLAGDVVRILCLADGVGVEALSESTSDRRRRRLVSPPAGEWISYLRPREALEPPRPLRRRPEVRPVVALRFALEGSAVPPLTEAIRLAERYRVAVLKRADGMSADVIARLRGRVDGAEPALVDHVHAHYLPTDEDGDGRLDHLTVWCPAGMRADEIDALDYTTLSSWAFDHPLRLLLLGTFEVDQVDGGPFASSHRWASHTPFLPPRHPKRRGGVAVDGYHDQLQLELARRGLPTPVAVRSLRGGRHHWGAFRRERSRRDHRSDLPALGFELEFAEPVRGPIALGRNSHFGMGLFLAADAASAPGRINLRRSVR